MIEIVEQIIGIKYGLTSYDDILTIGALILGLMCILIVIYIFKRILK